MKKSLNNNSNKVKNNGVNSFIPNSLRFISSCIKTVSSNVRSAGASVAGSISGDSEVHHKDQVLCACFDRIELGPSSINHVLLLGYANGFQVLDIEDASNVSELVSRRDDPVTFLQIQPIPTKSKGGEGFRSSHPLLLVVASDETRNSGPMQSVRDGYIEPQAGGYINSPTSVRFYSLRSHNYVHVLRFRSTVYMVRCSPRIVAVGLTAQIYCFDPLTLENKFSVLTYPVPQLGGQGMVGVNIGYGPMAVGPRWLAYASNNPLSPNTGRLSPQSLSPSPGISPSTSPGSGSLVAQYAMKSSKQMAVGLINLGDKGYKTLSKYCHELLPDASSPPVSTNSSWRVGRIAAHSTETDAAGMVVIKDFVSRAVISQFRAHASPISALCFDPTGTLLVTASIHGNNINVFRIMPSSSRNGSSTQSYDWSSSHVHLYKLHRGRTPAVIQDICFCHYSTWVAIVSSRGTCHIFVLSPFGGEIGLQIQNSHVDGHTLTPIQSLPWWSVSSLMVNRQSFPPPPLPVTLSVVSRIRAGGSGWLSTVSNAASSAAGNVSMPSDAVAAVFHSTSRHRLQPSSINVAALEYLLVYTPSGNVIQYELLPSMVGEHVESASRFGASSSVHMQEEELHVKGVPVQWWDVCRGADWPEREECVIGITIGGQEAAGTIMDTSDYEDNGEKNSAEPSERSHWYLSNAEVQVQTGRMPVWQKYKICFFTMSQLETEGHNIDDYHTGGEIEIEKIPVQEVEMRQKELLPIFEHFHNFQSNGSADRSFVGVRYSTKSSSSHGGAENFMEGAGISNSKLVFSPGSNEGSVVEPSRTLAPVNGLDGLRKQSSICSSSPLNRTSFNRGATSASSHISSTGISSGEECFLVSSPSSLNNGSSFTAKAITREVQSSSSVVTSDVSNTSSNRSDVSMNNLDDGPMHEDMHEPLDFGQYFQEEYSKASSRDECCESTEVVTDVDSSNSPCNREEKCEEDGENDDLLGGVFSFSEEG